MSNDETEVAENAEEYEKTLDSLRRILVATVTNEVTKNGNVLFFIRNCKRCHE